MTPEIYGRIEKLESVIFCFCMCLTCWLNFRNKPVPHIGIGSSDSVVWGEVCELANLVKNCERKYFVN